MIKNLRTHTNGKFGAKYFKNSDLCMHSAGYIRRSQSCGSMVSMLSDGSNQHFLTGTSAPCLSIFRPVTFDLSIDLEIFYKQDDIKNSLWFRHEKIHRHLLFNERFRKEFVKERDEREDVLLKPFENGNPSLEEIKNSNEIAEKFEVFWQQKLNGDKIRSPLFSTYGRFWKKLNKLDKIS